MDADKSDNQILDAKTSAVEVTGDKMEDVNALVSGGSENVLQNHSQQNHNEVCYAAVAARGISVAVKGIQVQCPPYRLRVLPVILSGSANQHRCSIMFVRMMFSQVGLALLLISWTMCCAVAFYYSEGPHEEKVIEDFRKTENDLAIDLSTQLRQVLSEDQRSSSYPSIVQRQLERHTSNLLLAVEQGYGGPDSGKIWNYSGCVLFAVSLLTTLGFGAPVPHTNYGRAAAVLFATIGVPLHFVLMFNIAQTILSKVHELFPEKNHVENFQETAKTYETPKSSDADGTKVIRIHPTCDQDTTRLKRKKSCFNCNWSTVLLMAFVYYILGIIIFGVARGRHFQDAVLFPLEFIDNALAQVGEPMRLLYAAYLEGLILHAALFFAVIRCSTEASLESLAYRHNLLTNAS